MTYVIMALRNIWQARRRTSLLMLALSMVSLLLIMLLSLSQGMTETLVRSATLLAAGHVNVGGFYKAKPDDAFPIVTQTSAIRALLVKELDGVDRVIDRARGWAKLVSETGSIQTGVAGIDISEEQQLLDELRLAKQSEYRAGGEDRVVGDARGLAEDGTAMIFSAQAERLGVDVGDVLTLTSETMGGVSNTGEVRVVAVAADIGFMSNWSVFVPKSVVRELYTLSDDATGSVMIYLEDREEVSRAMEDVRTILTNAGYELMEHQSAPFWQKFEIVAGEAWTGQKLDVTSWEDETSYMKWVLSALDSVSLFMVAILMFIIAVGIMNAMWISVRERTQEIGTLRAIGMQRTQILRLFVVEAAILGLIATTIGTVVGAIVAVSLDAAGLGLPIEAMRAILMSERLHLVVEPSQLFGVIVAFTLVTMLAALWPASRAARLEPVTAIHRVG